MTCIHLSAWVQWQALVNTLPKLRSMSPLSLQRRKKGEGAKMSVADVGAQLTAELSLLSLPPRNHRKKNATL